MGIENRWTFKGVFGVATAQLCPRPVLLATGDDFLHEGVGCLPFAQLTLPSGCARRRLHEGY